MSQVKSEKQVAYELVAMLSERRAESYNDWIRVGMVLKSIDDDLLELWDDFSRQSAKYKAGGCAKSWKSFKQYNFTIASLHHMAKEDNPDAYRAWKLHNTPLRRSSIAAALMKKKRG